MTDGDKMDPVVTVVIPTIKPRKMFLRRAVNSIMAQDMAGYPAPVIEIAHDREGDGAAATRNRALMKVKTPYVAFLDDDDYFLPHHLVTLLDAIRDNEMDVVYPMCNVVGPNNEPLDFSSTLRAGLPFSAVELRRCNYIPVTSMVKTQMAMDAQFGPPDHAKPNDEQFEDYGFYLRLLDRLNAKFMHIPEVTWVWHHHGRQTAGRGDLW